MCILFKKLKTRLKFAFIQTLILGTFKYTLHKDHILIYLDVPITPFYKKVPWFNKLVLNVNQLFFTYIANQ